MIQSPNHFMLNFLKSTIQSFLNLKYKIFNIFEEKLIAIYNIIIIDKS